MKRPFQYLEATHRTASAPGGTLEGSACSAGSRPATETGGEPSCGSVAWPPGDVLLAALRDALARARGTGREQLLAVCAEQPLSDPLALFAAEIHRHRFFWQRPAADLAMAALGCARALEIDAEDRFGSASRAASALYRDLTVVGEGADDPRNGPLLVGGFAFDPDHRARDEWSAFPAARLELPEILLLRRRGRCFLTVCSAVPPSGDETSTWAELLERLRAAERRLRPLEGAEAVRAVAPGTSSCAPLVAAAGEVTVASQARYCARIERALAAIASGQLEKVVLARSLQLSQTARFDIPAMLARLRVAYPDCANFAVGYGADCFLAASPERLVGFDGEALETAALAGTAPRGDTPDEDAELGDALRCNPKELAEHAAVVRAIRASLADVCEELRGPAAPVLLRIAGIQHLHTPLRGRLRAGGAGAATILDLVGRLHPTPAVGGLPRAAALDWIRQGEALERGWYAAPVGYVDRSGGGEFHVALRSALFRNSGPDRRQAVARLFAGAGIVAGSRAERELRETRLKMRALLAPLAE